MEDEKALQRRLGSDEIQNDRLSDEDLDILRKKIQTCWGVAADQLGTANIYRTAEYLYYSLYQPNQLNSRIEPSEKFPERLGILNKGIVHGTKVLPSKDEFIDEIIDTNLREVDYADCLYPEAIDQLTGLMKKGKVIIWSQGDMEGFPAEGAPGSHQQIRKIGSNGFASLRSKFAQSVDRDRLDLLQVAVSDNKMDLLPSVFEEAKDNGVDRVYIVDDKLDNLLGAKRWADNHPENDIDVTLIWAKQGRHAQTGDVDYALETDDIKIIEEIGTLGDVVDAENETGKSQFVIDYDGVLSDNIKLRSLQQSAMISKILSKGWI